MIDLSELNEDKVKAISKSELLLDHEQALSIRKEGKKKVILETCEETFTYEGKTAVLLLRQLPRGCFSETPELLYIYNAIEELEP